MKIGDKVYIRGYVDEIRKDTVIIHNYGGYFGTAASEIIEPERTCSTCRYNANEWDEEPCDSCTSGGSENHWKPIIEPERKKGKWVNEYPNYKSFWARHTVKCSICGNILDLNGVNAGRGDANFCPNCGAQMERDE